MTIEIEANEDGSYSISWDPEDPLESLFNTMEEEEFQQVLLEAAQLTLAQDEDIAKNK